MERFGPIKRTTMTEESAESTRQIERTCAICGELLEIKVAPDGEYDGGHYFGEIHPNDGEYWECDDCASREKAKVRADSE